MKEPVGRQLQKAREKTGLSTGDVAAAQHLRPSVIQAIESGDYSQIDSELFLKGYVRAYAKQVGLDADAVIADLDQELEPIRQQREQEQEANPLVDIERRRRRKRQLAKALFFLVVLG
ncbi:MAG: helix-turn-helix domain-containing protein, partial [Marinobacter sp.]|nr:helix-turn-helix domain-containing protein [Marinobacter sp.]